MKSRLELLICKTALSTAAAMAMLVSFCTHFGQVQGDIFGRGEKLVKVFHLLLLIIPSIIWSTTTFVS